MKKLSLALGSSALVLLALIAIGAWQVSHVEATPPRTSVGYEPQSGDVVFQSLPRMELVVAIEGATQSPLSHCGVVAQRRGRWVVVEAIGQVIETPLEQWIARGRGRKVLVCRPDQRYRDQLDPFVASCRTYLGRPYDTRYRMDDEAIYCSELVYKGFRSATGVELAPLVRLGDLHWRPYESTIRKYEGGPPPLDRQMITPRDLARSEHFRIVFDNGIHPN